MVPNRITGKEKSPLFAPAELFVVAAAAVEELELPTKLFPVTAADAVVDTAALDKPVGVPPIHEVGGGASFAWVSY